LLPSTSGVPELVSWTWGGIWPRLSTHTIGEIVSSTTYSQVKDEEEFSVKWCRVWFIFPWVIKIGRELTSFPEGLLGEVNFKNLFAWVIEIGVKSTLVPVETIGMEAICEWLSMFEVLVCKRVFIHVPVGSPMKGWTKAIVTTNWIRNIVTSWFHDVDFTRSRPVSIFVVFRKEPDCGPEPVSLGELSLNLNSTILGRETVNSSKSGWSDWVVNVSRSSSVSFATIESVSCALISWSATPDVNVSGLETSCTKVILSVSGLNVEDTILNVAVWSIVNIPFEFPVSTTAEGLFVLPLWEVKICEVILEDDGLSSLGDCHESHNW
jgi:hypothetical protein